MLVRGCNFLSEYMQELPSNCLFNKGVTGCGGTHLELHLSKRNSLVLVPMIELVKNKISNAVFGFYGDVSNQALLDYVSSDKPYKKIIGTYDCLSRFIDVVSNYPDYFLLIDEYHLLFNQYDFRPKAIMYVLNNFRRFKQFCFMTATPLKEEFILPQLKDLERIELEWDNAVSVNITIRDTYYIIKETVLELKKPFGGNYHVFLNSVDTIKKIIKQLSSDDYRVICSDSSKKRHPSLKVSGTKDPVCKYNFYTSYCSEGCDIFDENGKTIIVSDTNLSYTLNDISTTLPQICGRLRNSNYKDSVLFIVNTHTHRYLDADHSNYKEYTDTQECIGKERVEQLLTSSPRLHIDNLKKFNRHSDDYNDIYINCYNDSFFLDKVLKLKDVYNFELLLGIYKSSYSILNNLSNVFTGSIEEPCVTNKPLMERYINKTRYTFSELKEYFLPIFKHYGIEWKDRTVIKDYFPNCFKKIIRDHNKTMQVYLFNI